MKYQHLLIEKLGAFLEFEPDEHCLTSGLLEVDSLKVKVTQIDQTKQSFVVISAEVFSLKSVGLKAVLALSMSANHFWRGTNGATFSYDPLTEHLFLSLRFTVEEVQKLESAQVGLIFMDLYDCALHWQAVIPQLEIHSNDDFHSKSAHALSFGQAAARFQ